ISSEKDVLIDHLAEKRNSTVDSIETIIENTCQRVFDIDSLIRQGNFCDQAIQDGCEDTEINAVEKDPLSELTDEKKSVLRTLKPLATKLSKEQLCATSISENLVLTASAGSGKTFVLRTRVLKLILA